MKEKYDDLYAEEEMKELEKKLEVKKKLLEDFIQEKGIIQKKLKILVIDGKESGNGGKNWSVEKALIQNGTGKDVEFFGNWIIKYEDNVERYLLEEGKWHLAHLCYAGNADSASAVECLGPDALANVEKYSVDADVVVLVDSDSFDKDVLESKKLLDMIKFRKVISYGNSNKKLDAYVDKENKKNGEGYELEYVRLNSEEGCENLLEFIQKSVDPSNKGKFILPNKVKIKKIKVNLNDNEKNIKFISPNEVKIKKFKKNDGEGILHKVKKYAKENKKKTAAGGITGLVALEEFIGQFGFRKSILGAIFSNSKEKSVKDVKDNKETRDDKGKKDNTVVKNAK